MPFPSPASPPTLFPTYLVSSLPFRRRKSSTDSTSSSATAYSAASRTSSVTSTVSTAASSFTGRASPLGLASKSDFTQDPEEPYLSSATSHLRCARCLADLAHSSQIISKGFTGRHGRAYLVAAPSNPTVTPPRRATDPLPNLPNTYTHKAVPRQLVTGAHTVGDLGCAHCGAVLGWKYIAAEDVEQRYKVGKFILEMKRVCRASTWEAEEEVAGARRSNVPRKKNGKIIKEEEVEFDSQDEDECEDLFLGVWTPQLAAERRKAKSLEAV